MRNDGPIVRQRTSFEKFFFRGLVCKASMAYKLKKGVLTEFGDLIEDREPVIEETGTAAVEAVTFQNDIAHILDLLPTQFS